MIVTHESAADIEACLRSLALLRDGATREIIVVDNASADGTADIVDDLGYDVCALSASAPATGSP